MTQTSRIVERLIPMEEDFLRRRIASRNPHPRRTLRRVDLDATDPAPRSIPQVDEHRTKDTEARRGARFGASPTALGASSAALGASASAALGASASVAIRFVLRAALPLVLLAGCASTPPEAAPSDSSEAVIPDPRGAVAPTLEVGDPAPPILISQWIGAAAPASVALAPIPADGVAPRLVPLERGTVTMLDFWASWCEPCLASMDETAKLRARYGPMLRVIPVTAIDDANTLEAVVRAMRQNAGLVALGTAIDDGTKTSAAYRFAAQETGLPRSFLIDRDGRVAWIGDPRNADSVVSLLISRRWDRDAERARRRESALARQRGQAALVELQRGEANGDAQARISALRIMAALPSEAAPFPQSDVQIRLIEELAASGRVDEARGELHAAAERSRTFEDAVMLAALARAARSFDREEALAIALESERILDKAHFAWTSDREVASWDRVERSAQRRASAEACLRLAEVHRSLQRAEDAARLEARAADFTAERPLSSTP